MEKLEGSGRNTGILVREVGRGAGESRIREYKEGELFYLTFNLDVISCL